MSTLQEDILNHLKPLIGLKLSIARRAADIFGGAVLMLSGCYRLVLFPNSSRGEYWRFFRPNIDEPHFVVEGNKCGLECTP